jgi:hypothetical protein
VWLERSTTKEHIVNTQNHDLTDHTTGRGHRTGSRPPQTKNGFHGTDPQRGQGRLARTGGILRSRTQLADCPFLAVLDQDLAHVVGGDGIGRTIGKYTGAALAGGVTAAALLPLIPATGGLGLFIDGALSTAAGSIGYDIGGNIGDTIENKVNEAGTYANNNIRPKNQSLPVPSLFDQ